MAKRFVEGSQPQQERAPAPLLPAPEQFVSGPRRFVGAPETSGIQLVVPPDFLELFEPERREEVASFSLANGVLNAETPEEAMRESRVWGEAAKDPKAARAQAGASAQDDEQAVRHCRAMEEQMKIYAEFLRNRKKRSGSEPQNAELVEVGHGYDEHGGLVLGADMVEVP